jgi:hypothetical protein
MDLPVIVASCEGRQVLILVDRRLLLQSRKEDGKEAWKEQS